MECVQGQQAAGSAVFQADPLHLPVQSKYTFKKKTYKSAVIKGLTLCQADLQHCGLECVKLTCNIVARKADNSFFRLRS